MKKRHLILKFSSYFLEKITFLYIINIIYNYFFHGIALFEN